MEKVLAACGNDCSACPRYIAPPYEKTDEELRHTAELWLKIGYRDRTVSNDEIYHNEHYGAISSNVGKYPSY